MSEGAAGPSRLEPPLVRGAASPGTEVADPPPSAVASSRLEPPPRPALPETLWALVAVIACERVVLEQAPAAEGLAASVLLVAAIALAACLALFRTRARAVVPLVAVVGAALVASGVSAAAELSRQSALEAALGSSPVSSWSFEVTGDMSLGATGWRGRARVIGEDGSLGEVWLVTDEALAAGSTLTCVGTFEPNDDDDWGTSSRAQGLAGTVRATRVLSVEGPEGLAGVIGALREAVLESLDAESSDARALLAGSVCGSTVAIKGRGLSDAFAACGVSHLVAVSGGHLVLVTALAGALLERTGLPRLPRTALLLCVSALFVAFCGAPVSAVRSCAMSFVAAASASLGRRAHPLSSASAVSLALALADPGLTGQLGFLLSVICVLGICAFGSYARYAVRAVLPRVSVPRRLPAPVREAVSGLLGDAEESLALTLVCQAVSLPLTCSTFSTLSLVAPLANVVLGPLFSAFLAAGLVAACLFWAPAVQAVPLAACDLIGGAFVAVTKALAGLPLASVAVSVDEGPALAVLVAVLAVLLLWWPRVRRRAVLGALSLVVGCAFAWVVRWSIFAPARVCVLDVGQGDAILVTDGPSSILVDTGPGDDVVEALARNNVFFLDAVVLTHLHSDHAGGLEDVLASVSVGQVIVPEGADVSDLGELPEVVEVGYGDVLSVGRFSLRAVSPVEPQGGDDNAGSLELALEFDDGTRSLTGLLAADAEQDETGAAVERGDVGDIDFLKVGHHGSAASLDEGLAEALDPEVAVASAGEGNSYGHPTAECVEALEAAGALFLCTIDAGDVTVEPGELGPVVSCQRGSAGG